MGQQETHSSHITRTKSVLLKFPHDKPVQEQLVADVPKEYAPGTRGLNAFIFVQKSSKEEMRSGVIPPVQDTTSRWVMRNRSVDI